MSKINENLINEVKQKAKVAETIANIQNGVAVLQKDLELIKTPIEPDYIYNQYGQIIPEKWIEWLNQLSSDLADEELPIEAKVIMNSPIYNSISFARSYMDMTHEEIGDIKLAGTRWNAHTQKPISLQNDQIELVEQLLDQIIANAVPCTIKNPSQTREDRDYPNGSSDAEKRTRIEVAREIWHTGNGM